jgi:hypothetical protein
MKHFLLLLALTLPVAATAQNSSRDAAVQAAGVVYDAFFNAMTNVEMDKVVSLFTDDALFWGTNTTTLATDLEGVAAYFSPLRRNQPGQNIFRPIDFSVVELNQETLLLSGRWEAGPAASETFTPMRISLVLVQRDGLWKIAQFHNSMLPQ